jgi:hypothetical protein
MSFVHLAQSLLIDSFNHVARILELSPNSPKVFVFMDK